VDFNHPRQFIWNLDMQQYAVVRLTRRYEGFTLSPQTIVIDQVTTDLRAWEIERLLPAIAAQQKPDR
jgi:hypothetical protein